MFLGDVTYFIIALLQLELVTSQDEISDVKYIGCFSTQYAQNRDLGLSFHPFSWESCVLLCQSKGSRYAGLVQRKRMCYCGSYLVENSKLFQPRDCPYSCAGPTRRSCGGETRMTIYKLKDDDFPRILIATNNMISYLKNDELIPLIKMGSEKVSGRLRYNYKNNEIYFIFDWNIVRCQYSTVTNKYSSPSKVAYIAARVEPYALDWISDKLYYQKGDSIWVKNLNGSNEKILQSTTNREVAYMEIDPYKKKLFYNFDKSLIEYNLITGKKSTILSSGVLALIALDVHTHATFVLSEKMTINKLGYGGTAFYSVFNIPPKGVNLNVMMVDDENIIYIQKSDGTFIQYQNGQVKINMKSSDFKDSRAIHEVIQAPTKEVACRKLVCEHLCEYSTRSFARCVCPNTMQLDSTGRKCTYITTEPYSKEKSHRDDYSDCSEGKCSGYDEEHRSHKDSKGRSDECDESVECVLYEDSNY